MDGIFSTKLKKVGDQLVHVKTGDEIRYKEFIKEIEAGTQLDLFMEIDSGDGTVAQLAKVHKCIRVLANHTGHTFEEMKLAVKDLSGLVTKRTVLGREYLDWKSFGDLSRDDLNLAIQACVELGDQMGLNLR